jgi:hypothetical protein
MTEASGVGLTFPRPVVVIALALDAIILTPLPTFLSSTNNSSIINKLTAEAQP